MKRTFKVEKLPLDTLINLLIELYESGIDYIDLSSDNTDPIQDKLIIQTRESYLASDLANRKDYSEEDDEDENIVPKLPPTIETKRLTEDDLNELMP